MKNSKLIRILKVMTEGELKELEKYLKSPLFNESETSKALFGYLRKQSPAWQAEKLDKQKIWRKIMKNEAYDEVRCRRMMSNLVQLIEHFAAIKITFTPQQFNENLFTFYNNRYLSKDATETFKTWEDDHYLQEVQSADFYFEKMKIGKSNIFAPSNATKKEEIIEEYLHTATTHFIITQLQWQAVLLSNANIYSYKQLSPFIPFLLHQIEQNPDWLQIPAIEIYYYLYKMLQDEAENNYYDKLNQKAQEHKALLYRDEKVYIGVFLQNYCIRKGLAGNSIFTHKLLQLYQQQLADGSIFSYNQLKSGTFSNIIKTAIRCEEHDWAESFIENYAIRLPEEEKENCTLYGLALIRFEQKKFKEALLLLNEIPKWFDIFREIDVKILRIRTFFELKEWESMTSAVEALKVFIFREKKFSSFYKNRFKNFANFLYRISQTADYETEKWQKLAENLHEIDTKEMHYKDWLMEKIHLHI